MTSPDAEALAARLAEHPDYRVLRRLDVSREWPAVTGRGVGFAVVLDTETTGMDPAADKVIELALVKFEYSRESGAIGRVFDAYDGLEDPGMERLLRSDRKTKPQSVPPLARVATA